MRRIDKKLNIIKANLLTEQRYVENKSGLNEGPTTDIEGVTDAMMDLYDLVLQGREDIDHVDAKVYHEIKKTLEGHGADPETKKTMYMTLANKIDRLLMNVPKGTLQRAQLETKAKSWRVMADQVKAVSSGDLGDMFKNMGNQY